MDKKRIEKDFPVICVGGSAVGITIAQKPDTAAIPDMPESAIASGCIDYILSPEEIAKEVKRIVNA